MALVSTADWELEAKRINEAETQFDVLGLVPPRVTVEDVREAYDACKKRLLNRDSARNPTAQRAKNLLEKAFAQLGDATLLARTLDELRRQREARMLDANLMESIRNRTKELEATAELFLIKNKHEEEMQKNLHRVNLPSAVVS